MPGPPGPGIVGGTMRFTHALATTVILASALITANVATVAHAQSAKPKADDVGITPSEIHLAVIADVDTPVQPGLFQASVDAVRRGQRS